ncbi:ribosome assembly protein 4 [Colletotrichum truncatum]|uniref:Ribosome assembly protein 4 n=1 Tax=Colletotrichum truncatum TaxID=5467 RepID=A0ACC3YKU9_COLTU|nr:ribosome assembly protein 4 [Colletotrichum truncatum]KAF6783388.1 ribosome assembly protein 4 [Colletotrichum truncatum]
MPVSIQLDIGDARQADETRPSYEEAIAAGPNQAAPPRAASVTDSIRSSLSPSTGNFAPSVLRLREINRFQCTRGDVTRLTISPKDLVAVSHEELGPHSYSSTRMWDFRHKTGTNFISSEVGDCPLVLFSGDGRFSAAIEQSSDVGRARFRETGSKMWKSNINGLRTPAAFRDDGMAFAATDARGLVLVYETTPTAPGTKGMFPSNRVAGIVNHAEPTHVKFLPSGDVVTLSRDGTVRISDAKTGRTLRRMEVDGVVTATGRGACDLGVSRDGRVIVSVWPRAVYLWEHEGGSMCSWELNKVRTDEGWPLALSPDCRYLACRTENGMDISDTYSGQVLAAVNTEPGIDGLVTAAAFSPDGKTVAVGRYDGVVDIWETSPFGV